MHGFDIFRIFSAFYPYLHTLISEKFSIDFNRYVKENL